jgi:hypothetical protein
MGGILLMMLQTIINYFSNSLRRRHKKGFALIYVFIVMILLVAFTGAIVTVAASNIMLTSSMNYNYKLQLAAESGIQDGITALRNEIINYPSNQKIFTEMEVTPNATKDSDGNWLSYTLPNEFDGSSNNCSYVVDFTDGITESTKNGNVLIDNPSKLEKDGRFAIEITSTARFGKATKTIHAYIDERNIVNEYYQNLFKTDAGDNQKSASTNDNYKIINGSDSNNSKLNWPAVNINSATFGTNNINVNTIQGSDANTSQDFSYDSSSNLVIAKYDASNYTVDLGNITNNFREYIINNNINNINSLQIQNLTQNLDSQLKNYNYPLEYRQIIEQNVLYTGIYKAIFIHGNATLINLQHPLVNYIIYVDGNLTINGDIKMYNCSVFANTLSGNNSANVKMTGMNNQTSKFDIISDLCTNLNVSESNQFIQNVENNKIDVNSLFQNNEAMFQTNDKAEISDFLNKNLNNYYKGLQFKILEWDEK